MCLVQVGGHAMLASASDDRTVRLWDLATGESQRTLEGHTSGVNAVCPIQVGGRTLLASASDDRTVRLWDLATGYIARIIPVHHSALALISPSPQSLVVGLSSGLLSLTVKPLET